ncbi:hypothetical protein DEA8626_02685 [Defluviimonas aquaemixtae]|uniref:Sulfotransferase domain-containing protein n=1 Tax=Albidovulum aquaemixtae TaxID=1542388 RepID=A0A2R8BJQ9_9RHOB|nr:hypothetical protein [Defluviimonas aquaemixtae]SPH23619.1 hypothetical protein DEA8626_02685 [Defluviimonas aquaemixtae]
MAERLLLHIGYHKTATSWMQQRLFVPEHGYFQIARHAEVWRHVVAPHGLLFDPAGMQEVIRDGMAEVPEGKVPVISSEILSGHPFFGGMASDDYARRLKAIAPDARILISVRSQTRILTSVYMQYLLRGGTMSPQLFFAGDPELGFHGFRPEHFEYHRLIGLYQELFGEENVHVVTQESLAADMDGATRRLAGFAGNREFDGVLPTRRAVYAPSYPEYAVPILRRINKFQKSVLTPAPTIRIGTTPMGFYRIVGYILRRPPFSWLMKDLHPVSRYVEQTFEGRFDASNRKLAEIAGHYLDLTDYGIALHRVPPRIESPEAAQLASAR